MRENAGNVIRKDIPEGKLFQSTFDLNQRQRLEANQKAARELRALSKKLREEARESRLKAQAVRRTAA